MLVKASQSIARDGTEGILTGKGCKQVRAKQKTAGCRGADGGKELRCVCGGGGGGGAGSGDICSGWVSVEQDQTNTVYRQTGHKQDGRQDLPTNLPILGKWREKSREIGAKKLGMHL